TPPNFQRAWALLASTLLGLARLLHRRKLRRSVGLSLAALLVVGGSRDSSGSQYKVLPECQMQLTTDTRVCNRLEKKQDRAKCHSSAMDRFAYCNKNDGLTGFPPLVLPK